MLRRQLLMRRTRERRNWIRPTAPLDPMDRRPQTFPYYWRVKTRLPERFGQPCAVLVRGKLNSCAVAFEDGMVVVTSRNYVRRRPK